MARLAGTHQGVVAVLVTVVDVGTVDDKAIYDGEVALDGCCDEGRFA